MKKTLFLFFTVTFVSSLGFAQMPRTDFDCHLRSAWVGGRDVCLIKGESNPSVAVIGLHYGSLQTSHLIIEVLKTKISEEKLRALASRLELAISQTNEDPSGDQNMVVLESRVLESGAIVFPLPYEVSHLFISRVELRVKDRKDSLQNTIQDIFGTHAIGIISGIRRL